MIIKIISRKKPQSESDAAAMVRYVRAERPEDADGEKAVPGYGGNTFGAEEDEGELQLQHILELMRSNPGCAKPLLHGMISWAEDDTGPSGPSPEQVKEAVRIWTAELGLNGLDMLWALHGNTANAHVHVLVCMVDPLTGKARHLVPYRKACQKAKARIEAAQNLQPCAMDLYIPDPAGGGGIIPNPKRWGHHDLPELAPLTPEAAEVEQRHGVKPLQRRLQEIVPEALKRAGRGGWPAFHAELAEHGVEVRPVGRGMCFFMGTDGVKASNISRKTSRRKLEQKLGDFEPASDADAERASAAAAALAPEPSKDMPDDMLPYWEEYMRQREAWLEESRRLSEERRIGQWLLAERLKAELREAGNLLKESRRQGKRLLRGSGAALRAALKVHSEARRRALREQMAEKKKLSGTQRFPDSFAAWLMAQDQPAMAERWRMRGHAPAAMETAGSRQEADAGLRSRAGSDRRVLHVMQDIT